MSAVHSPGGVQRGTGSISRDKRLALTAYIAFYGLNGRRPTLSNDAAYDFVIAVAAGELDSLDEIAETWWSTWRPGAADRSHRTVSTCD